MTAADKIKALSLPVAANDNFKHGRAGFHAPHSPAYTADQMRALLDAAAFIAARQDAVMAQMVEALKGLLSNCRHGSIEGITMWHTKAMPTDAQLDAAAAALRAHKEME